MGPFPASWKQSNQSDAAQLVIWDMQLFLFFLKSVFLLNAKKAKTVGTRAWGGSGGLGLFLLRNKFHFSSQRNGKSFSCIILIPEGPICCKEWHWECICMVRPNYVTKFDQLPTQAQVKKRGEIKESVTTSSQKIQYKFQSSST